MEKVLKIRELIQGIFIIGVNLQKIADRILRLEMGLSVSQFRMLMAISHFPELSQRELADFWGVEEASVSRQMGILTKKKLISKKTNSLCKREHILELTPAGKKTIDRAINIIDGQTEAIFKEIDQGERKNLGELLDSMLNELKHQREGVHIPAVNRI